MIDPDEPATVGIGRAAEALRLGKVLAFPTETYYGLAADARNERALAAIHEAKGRPAGSPILLLLASLDQLGAVAVYDRLDSAGALLADAVAVLASSFWPGPLTIVLPARPELSPLLTAGTGTIGVRVSSLPLARGLAAALGHPITGTSANRSGEPPARTAAEARDALAGRIDGVIDGGTTPGGAPSTVVELTSGAPRLVRGGAVPFDRILAALGPH